MCYAGGGRVAILKKGFIWEGSATTIDRKGTPSVYLLLTNGTPFHMPCLEVSSLLFAVNALSLMYDFITKPQNVFWTSSQLLNASLSPAFGSFLPTEMADFATLSSTSNSGIPILS